MAGLVSRLYTIFMQQDNENDSRLHEDQQLSTAEEYLAERKSVMRRRAWWAVGIGSFLVVVDVFWFVVFFLLGLHIESYVNIFVILGLFFLAAGFWGLYEANRISVEDVTPTSEARDFAQSLQPVTPYYSQLMVGGFIFVFIAQVFGKLEPEAMEAAASLVKPVTLDKGEYWRLLTYSVMHAGVIHIFFNSYATFVLGSLIESISNRAHVALVFILSAICGGVFSCFFMPEGSSVGASGGIMGMIGFLAVYGYKRKRQLPSDFLRSMVVNIILIAGIGIIGYGKIDNAAHFGGLLMGIIYGLLLIPGDYKRDPRIVSMPVTILGYAAMGVFFATCILTILLLLEKITL